MQLATDAVATPETLPACCTEGAIHSGTPQGDCLNLHGLRTYIVSPTGDARQASATVVFLSDAFGLVDGYPNAKLVADEWAAKGYRVLLPDILSGDPMPIDLLTSAANPEIEVRKGIVGKALTKLRTARKLATVGAPWVLKHREAVTRPIVEAFLKAVRTEPDVEHLVVVGFCFGGRYALLVGSGPSPLADAVVAYHPSLVAIPADIKDLAVPTRIIVGDQDEWMPLARIRKAESVFTNLCIEKADLRADVVVYEGAKHGFAIRGHIDTNKDKAFRARALTDGLDFVKAAGL